MKKIVIIPNFCESHLIKYQIPNIIDTIDPDYIIYNEGMFPQGTEGNQTIDEKWLNKYTLNGEGKRGFDFNELKDIILKAQQKYPNTTIILNEMLYHQNMTSTECYIKACSNFKDLGIDILPGDYIFPYEADVFHHENSKNQIQNYLKQLTPDSGFRTRWIDFMENQYYRETSERSRRICIKFGTWEFYLDVLNKFMKEFEYTMLYPTDLITYHYAWWRPGKFKELRCDQLKRDSQYWVFFKEGLEKANLLTEKKIQIRYNRNDSGAYITYTTEFDHPKHIKSHQNWKKTA